MPFSTARLGQFFHWENDMRLPTYDEIAQDSEQLDVYEMPFDESLFVAGPPGSGKTVLAVHRATMMANAGYTEYFVTFNRMLRRLVEQSTQTEKKAVQILTMHNFVDRHFSRFAGCKPPQLRRFQYDWDSMVSTLEDRNVKPSPIHVIVDEGQDLPKGFYRYLRGFVATTTTVFADEGQAVTSKYSTLRDIKDSAHLDDPILLRSNHRNSPEIARVAAHFHAGEIPVSSVVRPPTGECPTILLNRNEVLVTRIANWFRNRNGRVGIAVISNSTGKRLFRQLQEQLPEERIQIYTHDLKNEDEIDVMNPGITILNVQSIKGQEFNAIFAMEFERLLEGADEEGRRKMYMVCARARDFLFLLYEGTHLPQTLLELLPGEAMLKRP